MELTDKEAREIKRIFSEYHDGEMTADEAMEEMEQLINE